MTHLPAGSIAVVGEYFNDYRCAARADPFVCQLRQVLALELARAFLYRSLDRVLRHRFGSGAIDRVPEAKRKEHQRNLARRVRPLQEKDGSFWDYQLFSYHKAYGTGYALVALSRCLPGLATTETTGGDD